MRSRTDHGKDNRTETRDCNNIEKPPFQEGRVVRQDTVGLGNERLEKGGRASGRGIQHIVSCCLKEPHFNGECQATRRRTKHIFCSIQTDDKHSRLVSSSSA